MRFAWFSLSCALACASTPARQPLSQAPGLEVPAHTQALIDAYRNREAMIAAQRAQPRANRCAGDEGAPQLSEKYLRRVGGCVDEPTAGSAMLDVGSRTQWPALYAALDARTPAIEGCIRQAHAFWELAGQLTTRVELDANGRIEAVRTTADDAHREEVACCVRRELRQAHLPAPGRPLALSVSSSYVFSSTSVKYRDAHLEKQAIKQAIERNLNDVRGCYDAAVKAGLKGGGRVTVQFVIATDGTVSRAAVEEDTLNSPSTACCIVDHLRSWKFPEPANDGVVVVSYPFTLQLGS